MQFWPSISSVRLYPVVVYRLCHQKILSRSIIFFYFFALFSAYEIKGLFDPIEFSNYTSQFRLIYFFSDGDVMLDTSIYEREEEILYFNYKVVQ